MGAPSGSSTTQGRDTGSGVGTMELGALCEIKALAEAKRAWAVGAVSPATLSRQRIKHREQDIILE